MERYLREVPKARVAFVERDGPLGGGQLALGRYFDHASKFDRTLIALDNGAVKKWADRSGVRSYYIGDRPRWLPPLLWHLHALRRIIRENEFDLIVANGNYPGVLLALLPCAKARRVFYCQALWQRSIIRVSKIVPLSRRWVLRRFRYILASSEFAGRSLQPDLRLDCDVRVAYTISGVSEQDCGAPDTRMRPDRVIPGRPLRVLSLSRHEPGKGLPTLIDAAKRIGSDVSGGEVRVTVAGDGDEAYSRGLRLYAKNCAAPVHFIGRVADVERVLRDHDVLVLASTGTETFGQVVIQGLAAGLVVIATNHSGPREILFDTGAGILVAPGDADALAHAIRSVRDRRALRLELSRNAASVARRFSDERMVRVLEEAIGDFVSLSRG